LRAQGRQARYQKYACDSHRLTSLMNTHQPAQGTQ
jgi:hypothetical protein